MKLDLIDTVERASALMQPVRVDILDLARRETSASAAATTLGQQRQRINYHVHALAQAGLLNHVGERRVGNMMEQRYRASADAYLLAPTLLGPLVPDPAAIPDQAQFSAATLTALAARIQTDMARNTRDAEAQGKSIPTLTIQANVRFGSAAQRHRFARELSAAVNRVIAELADPYETPAGEPAPGRPHRLILGVYPIPSTESPAVETRTE